MGLNIPGELADLLNELGYTWPKSDETQLFSLGQQWMEFSSQASQASQQAQAAVNGLSGNNTGADIEAFMRSWQGEDSAVASLDSGATGAQVLGGALFVCAGVVLALKINVIVQLTILAVEIIEAIATAVPTFGASLLEVPVFKKLCDIALNFIINQAMEAILG